MAKTSSSDDSFNSCTKCFSEHNRVRPCLCQCTHCSKSFCFDCMKDHNDEIQQNIAQVSNRYNELKELINKKKDLITNETIKSKEQMNEWLKNYIANLILEKATIDADIEKAEKEAQKFVHDIEAQLHTFSADIEAFVKNSLFQSAHMEKLLEKLNELIQRLVPLTAIREYDLPSTMPKYEFKFNYSPQSKTDEKQDREESKTTEQPKVDEQNRSDSPLSNIETSESENSDCWFPDENYFCNRDKHEPTSYTVNCMASDGINIMYSTIEDPQHERIAYCYLDTNDPNYRQADPDRIWHQSRIVDMIWWDNIDLFVCATGNGIYTVEYLDERFRILNVIKNRLTPVHIAANTDYIWVRVIGKIMIYNTNFQLTRSINFSLPRSLTLVSFCLTDNIVAVALLRRIENDRDLLNIEFYDFNMKRRKRIRLGLGETSCVIRTDGNDRFYVAMGQQKFFIVSSNGNKQTINLGKQASCLTVVNSRSIVLTKSRSDLELVKC